MENTAGKISRSQKSYQKKNSIGQKNSCSAGKNPLCKKKFLQQKILLEKILGAKNPIEKNSIGQKNSCSAGKNPLCKEKFLQQKILLGKIPRAKNPNGKNPRKMFKKKIPGAENSFEKIIP